MSFDQYQLKQTDYKQARKSIKLPQNRQQKQYSQSQQSEYKSQQQDKCQIQQLPKKVTKGKKKKIKKQQENEGIRIAKQKKMEYLFRNICNPNGMINIQSLGRALAKHKIDFKISQLQQMMALCAPDDFNEDSNSFQSEDIAQQLRKVTINYDRFRQFYIEKF